MAETSLDPKRLIFTGTGSIKGRSVSVSPKNSDLRHLHYGRIRLDRELSGTAFETGERETALLCISGECGVAVDDQVLSIGLYDALYIPRGCSVRVTTATAVDLVECAAPVEGEYPLQVVRYADVEANPALKFTAGGPATTRDLNIVIGKNVVAGRILAGFTRSVQGNWTSWPPHEHSELLEEVYVYFDMPPPAFGIQLVYTQPGQPEFVRVVQDGDAVIMPAGYHPNVAVPGHSINFIWMMAAHREVEGRLFGQVNVQPGFEERGSGLEASQR